MNRSFIPLLVAACLLLAAAPVRADFEEGLKAYKAEDFQSAYEIWLPMAEAGHARAQYGVGHIFQNAIRENYQRNDEEAGIPKIPIFENRSQKERMRLAKMWLMRAAEQGYARAQYALGLVYLTFTPAHEEKRVSEVIPKAIYWFKRAAEEDHVPAMLYLHDIFLTPQFAVHDELEAAKWGYLYFLRTRGRGFRQAYPGLFQNYFGELTLKQRREVEAWAEAWKPDFP
jgi:TPR repeat protein